MKTQMNTRTQILLSIETHVMEANTPDVHCVIEALQNLMYIQLCPLNVQIKSLYGIAYYMEWRHCEMVETKLTQQRKYFCCHV